MCIPPQRCLNDATCGSNMWLCIFAAENPHEDLTGSGAQIGLSDVELTAITMLEKEVGLLSYPANDKKCCLCTAVWCQKGRRVQNVKKWAHVFVDLEICITVVAFSSPPLAVLIMPPHAMLV